MAVLGDVGIDDRFLEIFEPGTAERGKIRAAKYSLRLGRELLILPNGKRYSEDKPFSGRRFIVEPGCTALVSTAEKLSMPLNLVGIISQTFDSTESGILFFGGMLVDPGFGLEWREGEEGQGGEEGGRWIRRAEPLSFHIANVGVSPLELRPGDSIASIAFLELADSHSARALFPQRFAVDSTETLRREQFADGRKDTPPRPLGLVEDLSEVRSRVDKLDASVNQVILFGVIVLAATLFAALTTVIFDMEPSASGSPNLEDLALAIGLILAELAGLVAIFYLLVVLGARVLGLRRKKRPGIRKRKDPEGD